MKQRKRSARALGIAAVSIIAVLLAGCSSSAAGTGGAQPGGKITFNATGGSMSDALKTAVVDPFTKDTGIDVAMTAPNDLAKIKLMAESGNVGWDVVTADPTFSMTYCDKYVEKLDFSIIDTSKLDPSLVSDCTVPMITPAYVLVYNTETYKDRPPTSWQDFFDTKNFPGSRGIADWVDSGALEAAMASSGATGKAAADIDVDTAFAELDKIKADTTFWGRPQRCRRRSRTGASTWRSGSWGERGTRSTRVRRTSSSGTRRSTSTTHSWS